jgi:hypothetical protein
MNKIIPMQMLSKDSCKVECDTLFINANLIYFEMGDTIQIENKFYKVTNIPEVAIKIKEILPYGY